MNYKPSQYNYITHKDKDTLRLYNTLRGKNSLLEIRTRISEAIDLLSSKFPIELNASDPLQNVLIERGYLVPVDTDEKGLRELKHLDTAHSNILTLMLIPTEECNFRCEYCNQWHKSTYFSKQIQDSILTFIRKNILSYAGLSIAWFGGEPLLAKNIIVYMSERIQSICRTAKRSYLGSITTNGYDLTPEVFLDLYNCGIRSFQITVDGFACTHDRYRHLQNGKGSFESIVKNLLAIKNLKLKYFNIAIRTNYTADMLEHASEFIMFLRDNFNNDNRFSVSIQIASDWGGSLSNDTKQSLIGLDAYSHLIDLYREYGQGLDYSFELNSLSTEIGFCYVNSRNFYGIKPDGTIIKCTQNLNDPACYIGLVKPGGIFDVDECRHVKWLFSHSVAEACEKCAYGGICFGSACPMKNIENPNKCHCPRNKLFCEKILNLFPDSYYSIFQENELLFEKDRC